MDKDGYVDLQFSGMGERLSLLSMRFKKCLESGMKIVKTGKADSIRIEVPTLNTASDFERQSDDV